MDGALFDAEASFCPREAGERERRKRAGDDGKGKERKRGLFPLPIAPRALLSFRLLLFLFGYPVRATAKERVVGA